MYIKTTIENFLNENKKIRNGLHVNLYVDKLDKKPTEIIKCDNDTLYVYIAESHTLDLMDNPLNQYNTPCIYHIIIDLDKKELHYPYPEIKINSYPKEVQDIFVKYINKYCK